MNDRDLASRTGVAAKQSPVQLTGTILREGRRTVEPMRTFLAAESLSEALLTTSVTVLIPEDV